MLARLYDPDVPRGDTGRARSSADVERNLPATGLTRADLSWRSFCSRASTPSAAHRFDWNPICSRRRVSACFARDGGALYAALDYGHSGGGHGHPIG